MIDLSIDLSKKGRLVGYGGEGSVYRYPENKVVKISSTCDIDYNEDMRSKFLEFLDSIIEINSKFIVKIYEYMVLPDGCVAYVMDKMIPLSSAEARNINKISEQLYSYSEREDDPERLYNAKTRPSIKRYFSKWNKRIANDKRYIDLIYFINNFKYKSEDFLAINIMKNKQDQFICIDVEQFFYNFKD